MSKSKKKAKGSSQQKRSNKFLANKLRTNQSRSAFKAQEELEANKQNIPAEETFETDEANNADDVQKTVSPSVVPEVEQIDAKENDTTIEAEATAVVAEQQTQAQPQQNDKDKNKDKSKDNDKKKKEKKGKRKFGQRTKETFAELKRVTWPTFGETMKKTGLVIAVVLFFGVALFAIERLLSWLYTLLTSGILN